MTSSAPVVTDDILFGGPVYNTNAGNYNRCYPYDFELKSFTNIFNDSGHRQYLQVVSSKIPRLNVLQRAVGRLAFWDEGTDKEAGNKPTAFLSGFFVSAKKFVTRPHQFGPQGPQTPIISIITEPTDATIRFFPEVWMEAQLIAWNHRADIAVFELKDKTVDYFLPMPQENFQHNCGDIIVSIGYNGQLTKEQVEEFYALLPSAEKPVFKLDTSFVNNQILYVQRKSLATGEISIAAQDVIHTPSNPLPDNVFHITCSVSGGSSGSPVFLVKEDSDPILIGTVLGGRMSRGFNNATLFSKEMIAAINGSIIPKAK